MLLRQRYSALLGGYPMTKITSLHAIAGALLACSLSAAPAHALNGRTWVSGHGTDSGACTLALPCKTFAFALTQTAAPGEIDVLDPGAFGKVTITQSISIVNDGVGVAAIGIASGDAITINAGASDSVHLRGLTIGGIGGATNGIRFNSGGNLTIENCVIRGFATAGINIAPSTSSSFSVSNTIVSDNFPNEGIRVWPNGSAVVTGVVSKITADNNNSSIWVNGSFTTGASLNVTIVDSEASNNFSTGFAAESAGGRAATTVTMRNSVASNNRTGLNASGAILRVAHSVVTGNKTGVSTDSGGTLFSYGDNDIDGNITDNTGVLTVISTH
jgi:hypothetical protein